MDGEGKVCQGWVEAEGREEERPTVPSGGGEAKHAAAMISADDPASSAHRQQPGQGPVGLRTWTVRWAWAGLVFELPHKSIRAVQ